MTTHLYRRLECGHFMPAEASWPVGECPFCEDYAEAFRRDREIAADLVLDDVFSETVLRT